MMRHGKVVALVLGVVVTAGAASGAGQDVRPWPSDVAGWKPVQPGEQTVSVRDGRIVLGKMARLGAF